jgi:hypothetical protein
MKFGRKSTTEKSGYFRHCLMSLPRSCGRLPTLPHWTKSLRDSLELTELVMLRGMRWCAALDRRRKVACRPHTVIDGKQG